MWCSSLGCYVGVGEMNGRHSGEAGGSGSVVAGMGVGVAGEQEDGSVEDKAEGPEDRTTKRRRVGITDG